MSVRFIMRAAALAAAVALEIGLAGTSAQAAQNKVFIDVNGSSAPTKGETAMGKAGWIEVTTFQWGSGRGMTPGSAKPGAGTAKEGAGSGKVSGEALNITVPASADEITFFDLAATGKHIPVVELIDYRVSPKGLVPIFNVQLKNVVVSSVEWTNSSGDRPTANISLVYGSVEIASNPHGSKIDDPATPVSWNRVMNKPDLSTTPP